jgi:hypothetical protein
MSEPSQNLRLPRRIRVLLGAIVGLFFGPLFAGILAHLPRSYLLGGDPAESGNTNFVFGTSVILGLCLGPTIGLAVSLVALGFQVWWWPVDKGTLIAPEFDWTRRTCDHTPADPQGIQTDQDPCSMDAHIVRRTDIR